MKTDCNYKTARQGAADGEARWYAVQVRHQQEWRVASALMESGLETFLPHYQVRRRWSDRIKNIDLPLFAGYLFCRLEIGRRIAVRKTPGVRAMVGYGTQPSAVPDAEIEVIRQLVSSRLPLQPWPYLAAGDRVAIASGPLRGVEGLFLRERTRATLVVCIELLQRAVAVEVDREAVLPVNEARAYRLPFRLPARA